MRFSKESPIPNSPRIDAALPDAALPGGEIEVRGTQLGAVRSRLPVAVLDGIVAPVLLSRSNRMIVRIPEDVQTGKTGDSAEWTVQQHRPAQDCPPDHRKSASCRQSRGGCRGQYILYVFRSARARHRVSVYRIAPAGDMQPLVSGIINATGLALDAHGYLYVSSRHDGTVHRVSERGRKLPSTPKAWGSPPAIAFDPAGNLYVGDRSGTIFKIGQDRQICVFATLGAEYRRVSSRLWLGWDVVRRLSHHLEL